MLMLRCDFLAWSLLSSLYNSTPIFFFHEDYLLSTLSLYDLSRADLLPPAPEWTPESGLANWKRCIRTGPSRSGKPHQSRERDNVI